MRLSLLLLVFLGFQAGFWWETRGRRPDLTVVPEPPTAAVVRVLSLGDEEFLFRGLAFFIQNFGDTWGRFTPLKLYNMQKVTQWFRVLDTLEPRSHALPSLAAYYFSLTQQTTDVRYLVDYLYDHAVADVPRKWWWLLQAGYLARHKLRDPDLELIVVQPLLHKDVPVFAQQMVAVVHEKRGEFDDALRIMETIRDHATTLSEQDLRYMTYFVEERLHRLEAFERSAAEDVKKQ